MKQIIEKLRKHTKDPKGDFPSMINLQEGMCKNYTYPFLYKKKKSDGSFTSKTYEMQVKINYNPFTGEKL